MKSKIKTFEQHLYHQIEDEDKATEYLYNSLPIIGMVIMDFNGLEKSIDSKICETFTERSDSTGLIVLHKMSYSIKIDLFKRFCDDFHLGTATEIDGYDILIQSLKESGRLRNLVAHADWENTDDDGYTYVNFKISKRGMEQEYMQFSEESLKDILNLIFQTRIKLNEYWEKRNEVLYKN